MVMNKKTYKQLMNEIDLLSKQVHELKKQIDNIKKQTKKCPICFEEVDLDENECECCGYSFVQFEKHYDRFWASEEFVALDDREEVAKGYYDAEIAIFRPCFFEPYIGSGSICMALNVTALVPIEYYFQTFSPENEYDVVEINEIEEVKTLNLEIIIYSDEEIMDDNFHEDIIEIPYEIGYLGNNGEKRPIVSGWLIIERQDDNSFVIIEESVETDLTLLDRNEFDEFWSLDEYNESDAYWLYGDDTYLNTYSSSDNNSNNSEFNPSEWDEQSYLRKMGYTVSKTENLSEVERQEILFSVIRSGKMNKWDIIDHLERMINLRKYESKYDLAVSKWRNDIEAVKKYKRW